MASDKKPVWYEKHPVSLERKKELIAKGYRIIDAVFKPDGYVQEGEDGLDNNGDGNITVKELHADLEKRGIAFKKSASKAELQELLLTAIAAEKAKEEESAMEGKTEPETPKTEVNAEQGAPVGSVQSTETQTNVETEGNA